MQMCGDSECDSGDGRYGTRMALAAETRIAAPTGRLRLVPARLAPDDAGTALALSAQVSVQFALAAPTEAAHDAPTVDMTDPTRVDLENVVGALPEARLLGMDEAGRADVVVFTDASLSTLSATVSHAPRAVVIVTEDASAALRLIHATGAHGWAILPPTCTPLALAAAIMAAAQGLTVLSSPHADLLLRPEPVTERHRATSAIALQNAPAAHNGTPPNLAATPTAPALTGRERETLELLSEGLSNKLIARRLRISEHTVKFHISALYAKLGASSRADAVSRAARRGVLLLTALTDTPTA